MFVIIILTCFCIYVALFSALICPVTLTQVLCLLARLLYCLLVWIIKAFEPDLLPPVLPTTQLDNISLLSRMKYYYMLYYIFMFICNVFLYICMFSLVFLFKKQSTQIKRRRKKTVVVGRITCRSDIYSCLSRWFLERISCRTSDEG